MALTAEEEQKIRALLEKQEAQKIQFILASKENFKKWLKQVVAGLISKLTDTLIDELFNRFVPPW